MDERGTGLFPDCVYCGSTAGWQMGQKGQDPEGTGCQRIAGTHFSGSCLCFYRIYQNIRDKAVSVGTWKKIWHNGKNGGLGSLPHNLLVQENLLNMIILFPLGILLPFIRNRKVRWWEGLFVGLAVSASIEILQLVLCRGLFEWDDMIHNGIGCMAGSILSDLVWKIWKKGRTGDSRNKK